MKIKPSALETVISTLPKSLQIEALAVVKEEHDRWERGDLTPEERVFSNRVKKLGSAVAKRIEIEGRKAMTK